MSTTAAEQPSTFNPAESATGHSALRTPHSALYTPGSALDFPNLDPWPDPVDGKVLLDELAAVMNRFLVLPKWGAETLALWTLHTYAFELRSVTAYVGIESPEKRCGKTTLLTVLSELVHRPVVAANISPSAFFRLIEEISPTLLIDEADTLLLGNDELRGILNSGYTRKTAFVVRVTHDAQGPRLARFSSWCPKAIASIGRLPDTLADRCILLRMHRKRPDEPCDSLRNLDPVTLCRQCARFIADHTQEITTARPDVPVGLHDRAADIWEPLFALADLAGGHWPQRARQAALGLTACAQENNPIGALLLDIFVAFVAAKADRIFSRSLVARLNYYSGRPWSELSKGKPITELWLAQQLRPYGIRPRTMRIDGAMAKGYLEPEFTDVFRRYIPRSEVEALLAESRSPNPPPSPHAPQPSSQPASPPSS